MQWILIAAAAATVAGVLVYIDRRERRFEQDEREMFAGMED